MQGLILHQSARVTLRKGTLVLPIKRWNDAHVPLRVLRAAEKTLRDRPSSFVSLCMLPAEHLVHVIVGLPTLDRSDLKGHPLNSLVDEDQRLISDFFDILQQNPPQLCADSISWIVRLVLCEPLEKRHVKWTKDIKLLEQQRRKTNTKRRK